jgi:UDP-glucose 4-epimerase
MRNVIERIEQLWCENMHTETMWPIHGKYRCGTCLREYVAFDDVAELHAAPPDFIRAGGESVSVS